MANVISPEQLRAWSREMNDRLVCTASATIIFISTMAALALLPAYIDVRADVAALTAFRDVSVSSATTTPSVDAGALSQANKRLAAITITSGEQRIADAIALMIDIRPNGARIQSFVYTQGDKVSTLDITGTITDRSLLKGYAETLRGRDLFATTLVPLASLAGSDSGEFSLSVTGNF